MDQRGEDSAQKKGVERIARAIEKHDRGEKLTLVEERMVAYTIYAGASVGATRSSKLAEKSSGK